MRRTAWLPCALMLAGALLVPTEAIAKGSKLRFAEERYAPGDRAIGLAEVETWKGTGEPVEGPFNVYLVPGGHPLHFGHLPEDAIPVGELIVGKRVAADTYGARVAFDVPGVPDDTYAVWVCAPAAGGTGCWLGFGDLVYGRIVVERDRVHDATQVGPNAPIVRAELNEQARIPWLLIVASLAGIAALGALAVHRRSRSEPTTG